MGSATEWSQGNPGQLEWVCTSNWSKSLSSEAYMSVCQHLGSWDRSILLKLNEHLEILLHNM